MTTAINSEILANNRWFSEATRLAPAKRVRVAPKTVILREDPIRRVIESERAHNAKSFDYETVRRIVRSRLTRALRAETEIGLTTYNIERNLDSQFVHDFREQRGLEEFSNIDASRFAGFVKGLVNTKLWDRGIEPWHENYGFNSPRNRGYLLPLLWLKHQTPGALQSVCWKARSRASQILSGWGCQPCWADTVEVLAHTRSPRRAAFIIAARTLVRGFGNRLFWVPKTYSQAVRCLAAFRGVPFGGKEMDQEAKMSFWHRVHGLDVESTSKLVDGVETQVAAKAVISRFGVKVYPAVFDNATGWLFTHPEWGTFHCVGGMSSSPLKPGQWAIHSAFYAFKRRKKLAREQEVLASAFQTHDRTYIVFRDDSYASGNCMPGTSQFLKNLGWESHGCIPASWLLAHRENPFVGRVLKRITRDIAAA